jgi:SAM-dependent methyltransferase
MSASTPRFTGERFVPGRTSSRIANDHLERYRFAIQFVRDRRVLDIACGLGYGSAMCVDAGARSVDAIDICRQTISDAAQMYGRPRLVFMPGDICTYTAIPYDIILCFETIEHLDNSSRALANLRALLAPGGTLLLSTPNRELTSPRATTMADKPRNRFHVREFVRQELLDALSIAGFDSAAACVYGQRQQPRIRNSLLRNLYTTLALPRATTSPKVTSVGERTPRYFVVRCHAR